MCRVHGFEEQRAVDVHQRGPGAKIKGAGAAGVDVLDEGGAGRRPVALPKLDAARAVVRRKEERAVDVRQGVRVRAGASGVDVLDQDGAGGRAVTLPQLDPMTDIPGREEGRPADL